MIMVENSHPCAFDKLFTRNVPHILEKIFLSLDYNALKKCLKVSSTWNGFLKSESFQRRAKEVFTLEIGKDMWQLCFASMEGDAREVLHLLSIGLVDINATLACPPPLVEAAREGHRGVVRILLDAGAEVNKKDRTGSTALMMAAARGHRDVAKMLLDCGADPNQSCDWGKAPLHCIPLYPYNNVVKLLLEYGADPNKVDNRGNTPMHEVAWKGHKSVAKLLVQKGAKVDEANDEETTPLHIASGVHHDLVNFLIDQGADPRKQVRYGPGNLVSV